MALGVLSDVHGNRIALEAVIADGRGRGVDRWWVLGDLVAIGPDPVATLELLTNLPNAVLTRGNTERYVLTRDRPPPSAADVLADPDLMDVLVGVEASFSWTRGALAAHGRLDGLADLPLEVRLVLDDGTRLLGVHAAPGRDDGTGITPHRPDDELRAELDGADADVVLTGHTHQPTDRWVGRVRAINGGSVSNPITDDLRAGYVVVHGDRHGHRIEHRRVAYDHDACVRRIRASGHPAHGYIASFQLGEHVLYPADRPGAFAPTP
jgi:predicted phosphodiesterase